MPSLRKRSTKRSNLRFSLIDDLPAELATMNEVLREAVGPKIDLDLSCPPVQGVFALDAETLFRIQIKLALNSMEAIELRPEQGDRGVIRIAATISGEGAVPPPLQNNGARGTILISVSDNGQGISADDLPHVFDPGFSTRKRDLRPIAKSPALGADMEAAEDGTIWIGGLTGRPRSPMLAKGTGLATVRKLAEAAGGRTRVVSTEGVGTVVEIELPYYRNRPARPDSPAAGSPNREKRIGAKDRAAAPGARNPSAIRHSGRQLHLVSSSSG